MEGIFESPALTLALAMAVGVLAVAIARHVRVPGIVMLLIAGVVLGPDVADVIRPQRLGEALPVLVGFAVAVILFEGGLHLHLGRLRRQATPIRRLVTVGAVVTAAGGAIAAHLLMGWDWRLSILFGTLVIVTGPTVVTPLLRRMKVDRRVSTILEAEGVFIDAIGATIAVVALEVALAPSGHSLAHGVLGVATIIGLGAAIGLAGGLVMVLLLRWRSIVPRGLENVMGLGIAVTVFQLSNALVEESGITAAIVAGMVVGNVGVHAHEELVEFKEQLTVLFIATLFVLLSADVRVADVVGLGVPGVLTVVALMIVVRPITVLVSTVRTELDAREKAFLSWLAPRGIVAAAVASLFAQELRAEGIDGGIELRALVFLVIATTVAVQGLSGGAVAGALGLRRPPNRGYVLFGADGVARRIAEVVRSTGREVVLIDSDPDKVGAAEEAGFRVLYGDGLDEGVLQRARVESREGFVAVTGNEYANFLFARRIQELQPGAEVLVALASETHGVTAAMLEQHGIDLLFGEARQVDGWRTRLSRGTAETGRWRYLPSKAQRRRFARANDGPHDLMLDLVAVRDDRPCMIGREYRPQRRDVVEFAYFPGQAKAARRWLEEAGWKAVGEGGTGTGGHGHGHGQAGTEQPD